MPESLERELVFERQTDTAEASDNVPAVQPGNDPVPANEIRGSVGASGWRCGVGEPRNGDGIYKRLGSDEFRRRLEDLRIISATLHRSEYPPRRFRKIACIAALEYGFNPLRAASGRLHVHVLLFNLRSIRLDDLAQRWRELNRIRNLKEPVVHRYTPGPEGILY
jgi:hypothetical protein